MVSRYICRKTATRFVLFALACLLIPENYSMGADSTWLGNGTSSDWSLSANWSVGVPQSSDAARFTSLGGIRPDPFLSADRAIGGILYEANAGSFTLRGPGVLTLNANNTTILPNYRGILMQPGAADQFISAPIFLGGMQGWDIAGNLTVSGIVSGEDSAVLIKFGIGTLFLNGANNYPGLTQIMNGKIVVGRDVLPGVAGPLGQATTAVELRNTATSTLLTGGAITVGRDINLLNGGGIGGNTADTSTFSGRISLDQDRNMTVSAVAGGHVRVNGAISSPRSTPGVTITGDGTVTLGGANTYQGTTVIESGTLVVGNNAALGNASSPILLGNITDAKDSALLIGGASQVARDIEVQAGNTGVTRLGGNSDKNATFSGAINLRKDLTITQAPTTGANQLTISGSMNAMGSSSVTRTATFDNAGTVAVTGTIRDSGAKMAVEKRNSGTLYLYSANSHSGGTTLINGYLVLKADNALGTGDFKAAGGTLVANSRSASLNALTILGNSTLQLGDSSAQGILRFNSGTWTAGTLTIDGWSGNAGAAGTDDRLYFTAQPDAGFLGHIQFSGYAPGATWLGTGELVPAAPVVPEPANVALAVFAGVFISFKAGKSLRKKFRA